MTDVAGVLAWCFHSPRRVLLVAVGLLAVLVAVVVGLRSLTPDGRPPDPAHSAAVPAVANAGPAVDATVAFTRAWASKAPTATAEQWRQGLHDLVTPDFGRLLATTDPAALPGGTPSGQPMVRFVAAASALVEVPLSTGRRVLVTAVLVNGRWLVGDVQPATGDAGDVGGGAGGAPGSLPGAASGSAG